MKRFNILGALLMLLVSANLWAAENLLQLNVFPNPLRASAGHSGVSFAHLTEQMVIRIYDAQGKLVLDRELTSTGGTFLWDLNNDSGQQVASGVYVFVITNNNGEVQTGKLALIQ